MSGSGPAYLYYLLESMERAALSLGLHEAQARQLALATCQGAATLARQTIESPALLRGRVTSKGGTTQAAVEVLEARKVQEAFIAAIQAAAERSRELSLRASSQDDQG
ncbi:pyrroline-5-carboxylate reductase family protein [Pseudomonas sp. EA_15y_Pfl2_R67]|uniref:pyrroline-5-carboxylate reductase family protein n=1 Tax=Pseudomonas sp. EA_15y_Pfl2_R67 TaxID=3088687 RepID=UPI0030D83847